MSYVADKNTGPEICDLLWRYLGRMTLWLSPQEERIINKLALIRVHSRLLVPMLTKKNWFPLVITILNFEWNVALGRLTQHNAYDTTIRFVINIEGLKTVNHYVQPLFKVSYLLYLVKLSWSFSNVIYMKWLLESSILVVWTHNIFGNSRYHFFPI